MVVSLGSGIICNILQLLSTQRTTHTAEPDSYGCVRLESGPAFYELAEMRMDQMK